MAPPMAIPNIGETSGNTNLEVRRVADPPVGRNPNDNLEEGQGRDTPPMQPTQENPEPARASDPDDRGRNRGPTPQNIGQTIGGNINHNGPGNDPNDHRNQGRQRQDKRCKKNTRASIKIAALNIRGYGNVDPSNSENKWNHINQLIRERRIGILVVGEAHLDRQRRDAIETVFGRRMKILFTKLQRTANAAGVAVVINKDIANANDITTHEIVPGHAILIETNWHNDSRLSILAIYAPNRTMTENEGFWKKINTFFNRNRGIRRPDIMLGDCNVTEDKIDRLPMRDDHGRATEALDDLKVNLQLIDGWRMTYPTTTRYTFLRNDRQARLDRIYIRPSLMEKTYEWDINQSPIRTDHSIVSVKITDEDSPEIGKGRWTWPEHLLKDKELMDFICNRGIKLTEELRRMYEENARSEDNNPQTLWALTKEEIQLKARERAKVVIPRLTKEIREAEARLERISNDHTLGEDERAIAMAALTEKLTKLEWMKHDKTRLSVRTKHAILGETICRFWSRTNKQRNPKAPIRRLKNNTEEGTEPTYVKSSQEMADLARDYHNNLQENERALSGRDRDCVIDHALRNVATRIRDEDRGTLAEKLSRLDIIEALRLSANLKAPGLDGITYEVWKALNHIFEKAEAPDEVAGNHFDIVGALTMVYNDIETHGLTEGSRFSESWMCPLYKKNDRSNIANYRPISLLNTDYKIMTKALSIKLAKAATHIIHPNQAGFVPGRQISDQIWLSKLVMNLAEATELNGALVALDQEKAYDKIQHDYLWKTLKRYGFPDHFINSIKSLYSNAPTVVFVNGTASSTPYQVTRGVRQGDPLSCLLFDIAIEPLAENLRKSNLQGLQIPNVREKLITTLFADDTTVYLSSKDDFGELSAILKEWCRASGAKFNISKTEVIPIGSPEFREDVRTTRKISGNAERGTPIPPNIKIAKDGEAIRSLGAMIGNNIIQVEPWSRILDKIDTNLARWEMSKPTMEGRRLIILMVAGAMTQYFTKVQGMPKEIELRLDRRIRKFMWAEKEHPRINKETVYAPKELGGRDLLDISARNEAISLTWLKQYLAFGAHRPMWAQVADAIFALNVQAPDKGIDSEVQVNLFLQSWNTQPTKLPEDLSRMLKVAVKYGTRLEGRALPRNIMREMPIWYHIRAPDIRKMNRGKESHCLKSEHKIRTVGETEDLANLMQHPRHKPRCNCACGNCKHIRQTTGCRNPHKCYLRANKLMRSLPPKWNPLALQPEDHEEKRDGDIVLNPGCFEFDGRITISGSLKDAFRIFTDGETPDATMKIEWVPTARRGSDHTVYTDGSCTRNGDNDAEAGAGVYIAENHQWNRAIRIPTELPQTNQTGEIIAIKEAAGLLPKTSNLLICSDSRTMVEGLTTHRGKWEDQGWIGISNSHEIQATIAEIQQRRAQTTIKWVKGHSGIEGNEGADKLADIGRNKPPNSDTINLTVPRELRLTGMKLDRLTQSLAYKAIRQLKVDKSTYQEALDRPATARNLDLAREGAKTLSDRLPENRQLWLATRHRDFSKKARIFLWTMIHNGFKIGRYWTNIPGLEERSSCKTCGAEETMEHILIKCHAPGQTEVWELAGELWGRMKTEWIRPGFGEVLACGMADLKDRDGQRRKGDSRLYRILVSESAHLIWRMRNARVINDEAPPSMREIKGRWLAIMNSRLKLDCLSTDRRFGKRALGTNTVRQTWNDVLSDKDNLPRDWMRGAGVLVGIRAGVG